MLERVNMTKNVNEIVDFSFVTKFLCSRIIILDRSLPILFTIWMKVESLKTKLIPNCML